MSLKHMAQVSYWNRTFRSLFLEVPDDPCIFSRDGRFVKWTFKTLVFLILIIHELVHLCSKMFLLGKNRSRIQCGQFVVNQDPSGGIIWVAENTQCFVRCTQNGGKVSHLNIYSCAQLLTIPFTAFQIYL